MNPATLSPWLQALAWALVHFLWQGALLGCAAFLALRLARRPQTRYLVACLGLLAMVLAFFGTIAAVWPAAVVITAPGTFSGVVTVLPPDLRERLHAQLPWILLAWGTGSALLALRMGAGLLWLYGPCLRKAQPAPAALEASLDRLRRAFRHTRPVRLLVSDLVDSPLVVGFWRAVILVPASALLALPEASLEAVLAHELAHIRRQDFLVNFLQNVAEVILFYHPAVWWLSREIRAEREHCCDDAAAALCGGGLRFAEALADLEALRHAPPTHLAPSGHGGSLMFRIKRLLMPVLPTQTLTRPGVLALAALTILGGGVHWTPLVAANPEPLAKPTAVLRMPELPVPAEAEPLPSALYQAPLLDLGAPDPAGRSLGSPILPGPLPVPADPFAEPALLGAPKDPQEIRLVGCVIPAHASASTFRGILGGISPTQFELPPHSRLTVSVQHDGQKPFGSCKIMVSRPHGEWESSLRLLDNTSDQTRNVYVSVEPITFPDLVLHHSITGATRGYYLLEVGRSWDPATQDPRAKRLPWPAEALKALPLVKLSDIKVGYSPWTFAYPPEARAAGIEGTVHLQVVVDMDGWPVGMVSEGGTPALRAAAEDYGWHFKFSTPPSWRKVKAVRVPLEVDFRLNPAAQRPAANAGMASQALAAPARLSSVLIPAHAAMATIQGHSATSPYISFEIPPRSRLKLEAKPAGTLPQSVYRIEVLRKNGPVGFLERALNNTTDQPVIVDLIVIAHTKHNDGLRGGSPETVEQGPFTLDVTRSWDPAGQDPRARAQAPARLDALPEVPFSDLRVAYRPVKPDYPAEALAAKTEATVALVLAVDRDGRPVQVRSEGGTPAFRAAAEAFAWRWVFYPPMVQGENRAVRVPLSVNFRLQ
jgi:TonB family protein